MQTALDAHRATERLLIMADARSQARRWGVFDYAEQQKEQEKKSQSGNVYSSHLHFPDGVKPFRFPEKRSFITIDIIPFLSDYGGETRLLSEVQYFRHNNIGLPNSHNYVCPKKTMGKPCPICDAMYKLDFNDPEERAIRNDLRPKDRRLYLMRWLDGPEEAKETMYILDQSDFLFGDLIRKKLAIRDREDPVESRWVHFPDLMEGFMLKVGLSTEMFRGSPFVKPVSIDFKPRNYQYASTPEEEDAFLATVPDLYKCLQVLPYDELDAIYQTGKRTIEPVMNDSPTQQQKYDRLDPTQGHNPIVGTPEVLHDVSVFTSQSTDHYVDDVESDVPF